MKQLLMLTLLYSLVAGCGKPAARVPAKLETAEVQYYQGERLGSILDFRENSIRGPQQVDLDIYKLQVKGLVDVPQAYTYKEVLDFPIYSKVVTIHCVEGWSVKILWEGVLLEDILGAAGMKTGANTVIFHGHDGYSTSLPLDYVLDNDILMAYRMNGLVLPPERGFPFQVVAESKLGYKWAKWVTGIEVSNDFRYRGFWESRGYDNDADVRR
jgi:DMSO/TMAO reductase YedYZ molybdopterin-dependent catalytic subunit